MKTYFSVIATVVILSLGSCCREISVTAGEDSKIISKEVADFSMTGEFLTEYGASATIAFHRNSSVPGSGYEVVFHNGDIDGTIKSGSLLHVRNLYRSLAADGQWCPFCISVNGKNVRVDINGTEVVNYTEPQTPYRTDSNAQMLLGKGSFCFSCQSGTVQFRNLKISGEPATTQTPDSPSMDEQTDLAIRAQQRDFPVIDWHIHLKGGLTMELADSMSKAFGINYGVAPNAGEGGVGQMLSSDEEIYSYFDQVKDFPFLRGVQGEGRRWTDVFSREALGIFDYLFTDAMTIVDHKGRISRIYRPEEVLLDDIDKDSYMDHLVGQTVKILSYEPADIYANASFIPDCFQSEYETLWTDERVDNVLDVMKENGIALEISARYRIPSEKIIRRAKEKGLKFVFGTNNGDADFGRLEYCLEMVDRCGLTPDDMWYPSMSKRNTRTAVIYNVFTKEGSKISLFDGETLDGWVGVSEKGEVPEGLYSVKEGSIFIAGEPFGYLRTAKKYTDYKLHVEWRWVGKGTNSGIFQRVQDNDQVWPEGVECQLMDGKAGDLVMLSGARIKEIPFDPAVQFPVKDRKDKGMQIELPYGQWNRAEIICKGHDMLVYINGRFENKATLERTEGYIALQSEGGPIEFRNIYIESAE